MQDLGSELSVQKAHSHIAENQDVLLLGTVISCIRCEWLTLFTAFL